VALGGQLTRRLEDQVAEFPEGCFLSLSEPQVLLENGQKVRGGLTRASDCVCEDVVPLKDRRNDLSLNHSRVLVVEILASLHQGLRDEQLMEGNQILLIIVLLSTCTLIALFLLALVLKLFRLLLLRLCLLWQQRLDIYAFLCELGLDPLIQCKYFALLSNGLPCDRVDVRSLVGFHG
jgi:hypothetical protein